MDTIQKNTITDTIDLSDIVSSDTISINLGDYDTNYAYSTMNCCNNTITTVMSTGTSNGVYATDNTTGYPGSQGPGLYSFPAINNVDAKGLQVKGDSEFDGDIKIKGKSLNETLDKIEQRLAILNVDPELEERWAELKKIGDAYRTLEKDLLEKEKIYSILKKS